MLELRPNCELCDADLPPDASISRICSHECTFCASCVDRVLRNVCPNCGGGFAPRPIRPRGEWRPGTGLPNDRPGIRRRRSRYSAAEIEALSARLEATPPHER
jgi:hypothetical protein